MSQGLRVLQELGEQFDRLAENAGVGSRAPHRARWQRVGAVISAGRAVSVLAVCLAVAIGAGAIVALRHSTIPSSGTTGQNTLPVLMGHYRILRRPQTATDRSQSGSGNVNSSTALPLLARQLRGLPQFVDVPALTRVVNRRGVRVSFLVEHLTAISHPLHTIGKSRFSRQALTGLTRTIDSLAGYSLWVRVAGSDRDAILVAPRPAGTSTLRLQRLGFDASTLAGPTGDLVAIVPNRVARVNWSWPREFNAPTLSYLSSQTLAATASSNVAVASSHRFLPPQTVTWLAASGLALARYQNANSAAQLQDAIPGRPSQPGPQTPLSRRAERDPSTANRVVIVPQTGTAHTQFTIFFRALLNGHGYTTRVTGGPRAGCAPAYPPSGNIAIAPRSSPVLRGQIVGLALGNSVKCPGTYRVSVSVLGAHSRVFAPFGSATFAVH